MALRPVATIPDAPLIAEVETLIHSISTQAGTTLDVEQRLRRIGYWLTAGLCAALFLSKPAIDTFLLLALLVSVLYLVRVRPWKRLVNPLVRAPAIPVLLGVVCGVLSLASWMGPLLFLEKFRSVFVLVPLILFVRSRKDFSSLLIVASISALISIGYAYAAGQTFGNFNGLHRIGRQADMLMLLCLGLIPWLFLGAVKRERGVKLGLAVVILLLLTALALTSIRGAWLGFALGLLYFSIFYNRWLFIAVLGAVLLVSNIDTAEKYRTEATSISDLEQNESNVTRLSLWQVGLDFAKGQPFFGTGSNNSEKYFIAYFSSMPESYQQRHKLAGSHTRDWHNSYLQILVQNGVFVLAGFLYLFALYFFRLVQLSRWRDLDPADRPAVIGAILVLIGFGSSQFFHSELFSYGAALFYLILYGGLRVCIERDVGTTQQHQEAAAK